MNWLTNFVRPKIRALVRRTEVPDKLWTKCTGCGQMLHHKAVADAHYVCPECDHHMRVCARDRFEFMFDSGIYSEVTVREVPTDPLRFRDQKRYIDRLKDMRGKTGQDDTIVVGRGRMGGHAAVVACQTFDFLGGSMGMAAGEAVIAAARAAIEDDAALIMVTAAGGARMQEGILSLMQMPRTTIAVQMARENGLPYIVVLTDPTTGGVTASYAMLGDITIAEPGALIGFAGPRVIESTIRERLPEGFQRAEYLLEHGMIDMVVHRHELRETLIRIVDLLRVPDRGARGGEPVTVLSVPLEPDPVAPPDDEPRLEPLTPEPEPPIEPASAALPDREPDEDETPSEDATSEDEAPETPIVETEAPEPEAADAAPSEVEVEVEFEEVAIVAEEVPASQAPVEEATAEAEPLVLDLEIEIPEPRRRDE